MSKNQKTSLYAGRKEIAALAQTAGEAQFAREVLAGCWDHRGDVKAAIERAKAK